MGYFPGWSISMDAAAIAALISGDYVRFGEGSKKSKAGVEAARCMMHSQRDMKLG
jgi:hypothetical protein